MPEEPEFDELRVPIFEDPLLNENEYFEVLGVFQDLVLLECCHAALLSAFAPSTPCPRRRIEKLVLRPLT